MMMIMFGQVWLYKILKNIFTVGLRVHDSGCASKNWFLLMKGL